MIATEYQAQITRDWIARFEKALEGCLKGSFAFKAYTEQVKSLKFELDAYQEGKKNGWLVSSDAGRTDSGSETGVGDESPGVPGESGLKGNEPVEGR